MALRNTRTIPLARTGDAVVDEQFRRTAQVLARPEDDVTTVAGDVDGQADLTAERVDWVPADDSAGGIYSTQGTGTSTSATAVTLTSWPLAANRAAKVTAIVVGRKQGTGDVYAIELTHVYNRIGTGAAAAVGSATSSDPNYTASASTWTVAFDLLGNDIRLRATGAASSTIRWRYELRVQEVF